MANHIVYCWELGSHYGHIARIATLAPVWQAQGHRVSCILKESRYAESLLHPLDIPWFQAPIAQGKTAKGQPKNHADILARRGYHSTDSLLGLLRAWINLLRVIRPDKLILDFAPTASLAAKVLNIPLLSVDNGFFAPPLTRPLPPFRDWEPYSHADLRRREQRVLDVINSVLQQLRQPPLPDFTALFDIPTQICTWPELNPFGHHSPEKHIGPLDTDMGGEPPHWPPGDGDRVFIYLRNSHRRTAEVVKATLSRGFRVLAFIPDAPHTLLKTLHAYPNFSYSSKPINLAQVIEHVSFGILHGGATTLGQFAIAGKPALLLPTQTEQAMVSRAAEQAGVAVDLTGRNTGEALDRVTQLQFSPKTAEYFLRT